MHDYEYYLIVRSRNVYTIFKTNYQTSIWVTTIDNETLIESLSRLDLGAKQGRCYTVQTVEQYIKLCILGRPLRVKLTDLSHLSDLPAHYPELFI